MTFKELQIFKKTNGHCFYCGYFGPNMEIDHFVPRSQWKRERIEMLKIIPNDILEECWDYEDKVENLFLSCRKCNRNKSSKSPEEFIGNSYLAWKRYENANWRAKLISVSINKSLWKENQKRECLGLDIALSFHGGNEVHLYTHDMKKKDDEIRNKSIDYF